MVNNTITMFENQIDTCMNWLIGILDKDSMEECMIFIKTRRESRHIKAQIRQVNKFNQLSHRNRGGHSNHLHGSYGEHSSKQQQTLGETRKTPLTTITEKETKPRSKWVINISSRPLSTAQESLLACWPNFAVVPRSPPL